MLFPSLRLFSTAWMLLNLPPALAIETVSIVSQYPSSQHACVTNCIWAVGYTDIGNALSCANPYANNCFCNTPTASASAASSWLAACGSSRCSAGDITADITAMHYLYASYCINAGYTQPGATNWYPQAGATTARPGQTPTSNSVQTTTVLTVVTETVPSTPSSAVSTQPQVVTVHATSTLFVDSSGNPVTPRPKSGPNKTALGVGIGLGAPLALSFVAWGIYFCRRRQRGTQPAVSHQVSEPGIEFVGTSIIQRKPLNTQGPPPQFQASEATAGSDDRMDTFPVPVSPGSPTSGARQGEVGTEGSLRELSGHSQSPPPAYLSSAAPPPASGQAQGPGQRWELG